ncbi:Crinkler (CRN) family protein [Phytophthora palmivora]|uniref:Crinkler (CRN) family protein n=1 Tax=Phytophthora palmivora TaxID=4796 RepID=A0A2P4YTG2_9STRA|nr:Crinkler (CRN) family protein [Phytophthora palmivora]
MDKQLEMYKHAESMGAFFHGVTYELLFHRIVREANAKRRPVVLNMQGNSNGEDEATCYSCLKTLGKESYWHSDYPFFPFVDAVTTCKAYSSGRHKFQTIMAFIQVTIQSEKKFEEDRLRELNDEMDKNESLRDMERAFVVVCPNFSVCEEFVLHNTPKPEDFLTMVGCFDPNQLEAKHA